MPLQRVADFGAAWPPSCLRKNERDMKPIHSKTNFPGLRLSSLARIAAILFAVGFFLLRGMYAAEPQVGKRQAGIMAFHADQR